MAIQLFVSNNLNKLATQLATDLRSYNPGVFVPQQIVTQTDGMNNWLKITLAGQLGITANCVFKKPNDIVSAIYYLLGGFDKPILNPDFVKWNLYHYLNEKEFISKFPVVSRYYENQDVKRIALATKVADLFDQYQVYRPEAITEWEKSELESITGDWQHYLWVRLYQQIKDTMFDKTDALHMLLDYLKSEEKIKILKSKLPHLHFFGIAVITPFYLQLFYELSRHIDISFYLLNPAPTSYWLEDKSEKEIARIIQKFKIKNPNSGYSTKGNELLQSLGNIIKESFSLLFEQDTFINHYNDDLAEEPQPPTSLLEKIQHDIYFNATQEERNLIEESDLTDGTITINSCFTLVREVEVLYNYLVHLVDQQKEKLSSRDIVVMVSDIDNYAPYIRAVFDNAPYYFPYTIADESISAGNSMFTTIETILGLQADSFKSEEILELLESPYIRRRFSLHDTELIRKAVEAACIRFGDAGEKENDTRIMSWQYGLKRIIYGICISGEPVLELDGDTFIPIDNFEGVEAQELIRFWNFFTVLEDIIKKRNQDRSIAGWSLYLQELVDSMVFEAGEKDDDDYHRLINYLEKLTLLEEVSSEPISFEVFRHSFLEILNAETKAMSFAGSGITFCSLIPMRSIPFKVVAMLGMDFDKFPRKESKISFSLLEKEKRKGDRNVKDNDKHLFLETLLSARQYFYLSYIGCSPKDAVSIPPSSMLDELIEYIIQPGGNMANHWREKLVTQHPLHSFSQRYFNGGKLYTYLSDEKYRTTETVIAETKALKQNNFEEIEITNFLAFFRSPVKWYFNKGLGIFYTQDEILLPDTEEFDLNGLDLWQVNKELLNLPETEYEAYYQRLRLNGKLPLKNMGRIVFDSRVEEIKVMSEGILQITQGLPQQSISIRLKLHETFMVGKLDHIYGDRMIYYSNKTEPTKNIVEAFISYLLAIASGNNLDFYFKDFKKGRVFKIIQSAINANAARDLMIQYLEAFKNGFEEPFLFVPEFGTKLFEKDAENYKVQLEKLYSNDRIYLFQNEYMSKALECDFFSSANFDCMKINAELILKPINEFMPGIIK